MLVYYNNINYILSKILSTIIIFQIFNTIKAQKKQESINKAQKISRIIYMGDIYYRYMNFASYSNRDMVVETTCFPKEHRRMFYGLKANGRPFFKDKSNNKETPYYSINVEKDDFIKFESVGIIIKLSSIENNGKEYYFSISKLECNAELFDFEDDKVYTKSVDSFTTLRSLTSLRSTLIPLLNSSINLEYYYLFGFSATSGSSSSDPHKIFLQKHKFESLNTFETTNTFTWQYIASEEDAFGLQTSCFETSNGLINCFYLTKKDYNYFYHIVKYTNEFTDKIEITFLSHIEDENTFLKCIHLKDEIGVYAYYTHSHNLFYPAFFFMEFDSDSNSFLYYITDFEISKHSFLNNLLINDLIKLTESKIVFSSVIEDKTIVYIILISIFGDKKIKIRYYPLKIYETHHLKVLFDLRLHNYNNFIALGLSLCPTDECLFDNNTHYSTLMILNYPNSTDETLYLDDYLFNNNNITIDNIEIDLKENLKFENNIFGYIFLNTSIINIIGCGDYKFYFSTNEEAEIKQGENLEGDKKIKIKYKGNDNFFPLLLNCQIEYSFIATEPDLNNYDNYTESIEGENDLGFFEKENYTGRSSYYNIKLTQELSHACQDMNCDLCYKNINDHCITCNFNFNTSENSEKSFKQCFPPETDLITEQTTESLTEGKTESLTERITNIFTEKETFLNEKVTAISTEKTTENVNDETTEITNQTFTEAITQKPTEVATEKTTEELINKNKCSKEVIILNECKEGLIYEEQINDVYDGIKDTYLKNNYTGSNTLNNTIIQTQNVIFQVSTVKDQKNSENQNVSNIDLGICEEKLRSFYTFDEDESLIIIKVDTKSEDLTQTFVQYEIYNPRDLTSLDLSICKGVQININTPVVIDNITSNLYDKLKESGYNLFDENDTFYTDICSTYTTENGTDLILSDRKTIIFSNNGNKTLCQSGCEFESYNSNTKKASCKCIPQLNESEVSLNSVSNKFEIRNIADSFLITLKYSNFFVMKCYKLAIDLKSISSNIGRIFMTIIIFFSLVMLIVFCFYDNKKIESFIQLILNIKLFKKKINQKKEIGDKINNKIKKINVRNYKKNKTEINKKRSQTKEKDIKIDSIKMEKTSIINKTDKNLNKVKGNELFQKSKKKNKNSHKQKDKKSFPPKIKVSFNKKKKDVDKNNLNNNSKSKLTLIDEDNKNKSLKTKNCKTNINIFNIGQLKIGKVAKNRCKEKSLTISLQKNDNNKKPTKTANYMNSINNVGNNILYRNLNDEELNSLEYTIALEIDKRTYFQYYWSLLKKKHLILFTFYPNNDYNIPSIKIFLFLVSFSLYFSINGFFFNDDTMHKINEDHGNFNLLYQLPQIFYSSIISAVINIILKHLSLSEKNILALKKEQNYNKTLQYSNDIKNCLAIKFIIFYILSYLFLMFFWYFIACFCGVYVNTQIILIKDTLISFCLSMVYPFGLNLIPGFFRIPALRAAKRDKYFIYKISLIIALFI